MEGRYIWLVWLLSGMGILTLALCLTPVSYWLQALLERVRHGHQAELEADAEAFGEPTRELVESRVDDDWRMFQDGKAYFGGLW